MSEWEEPKAPDAEVSLADMETKIELMLLRKKEYEEAKEKADALWATFSEAQYEVMNLLEQTGRNVFISNTGKRITMVESMSVPTPKTPEEKVAFFDFLKNTEGEEFANAYLSVNSKSLQSLYNELSEKYAAKGEVLNLPGVGQPVASKRLQIRNS